MTFSDCWGIAHPEDVRGSSLEWSKKPKKDHGEARPSHQRRCGAERLACFEEKKIGRGHRPQCLIRQCFYPASTLKPGLPLLLLLAWEKLNCTPEMKSEENMTCRGYPHLPTELHFKGRRSSMVDACQANEKKRDGINIVERNKRK